eukprot:7372537-Karenia_brevis.AAC.1
MQRLLSKGRTLLETNRDGSRNYVQTYGIRKHDTITQISLIPGGGKEWQQMRHQEAQLTADIWERRMNDMLTEQDDQQ